MRQRQGPAVSSLYVHVPFCARKCAYCAFYSERPGSAVVERFLSALCRELDLVAPDLGPGTIFFGGGTPSLLSLRQWERVLRQIERLDLLGAFEWTVECNPATVSLDKARLWRSFGVNRVSLGVQSLDPGLLELLGRIHTREAVFGSFELLRRAGFDNINLDLIFAIPGQDLGTWRRTLDEALALESEHLSCYELTYEDDTPLLAQLQAGRFQLDQDLASAQFEELLDSAAARGLIQYEISNFARGPLDDSTQAPARACQHNLNYWRGGSYYGLGPSAAGFVRGARTKNAADTGRYCAGLEKGFRVFDQQETLSPLARAGEIAAFGLRTNAGWEFARFIAATGFDLRSGWEPEMTALERRGWARRDRTRFALNSQGLRFADAAAEEFLRAE